ncbi:hypothetical protein AU468_08240 [Alkalispirochaeta sphaeroplastigenens]|uniref:Uncharacterized protein n=1 Tax=Alkalispirochaeta sphaeroplastigenens TaxID=1187066 RepID=A0A2S4JP46_9SPIO|nr:hypothetical protein [Alkalispirochaeta sphaeroplastigenens]POR01298.1 hypothetical protein AU468_08240 [Alkalispirochaeta sphaeroplastigenens]
MTQIGIQLADGSFFPVLSQGDRRRKRVVLTPAQTDQPGARVAVVRRQGSDEDVLGELILEGPFSGDDAPLELLLGIDQQGVLTACLDGGGGRVQRMECSLAAESPLSCGDSDPPRSFHWTVLVAILLITLSLLALGAYGFMTFLGGRIAPDLRAASVVLFVPGPLRAGAGLAGVVVPGGGFPGA